MSQSDDAATWVLRHEGALLDDPDLRLRQVPFTEAAVRPEAVTRRVREAITHHADR
jgi:hypothetical protein